MFVSYLPEIVYTKSIYWCTNIINIYSFNKFLGINLSSQKNKQFWRIKLIHLTNKFVLFVLKSSFIYWKINLRMLRIVCIAYLGNNCLMIKQCLLGVCLFVSFTFACMLHILHSQITCDLRTLKPTK